MAYTYTYSDVQNSTAAPSLEDGSSVMPDNGTDPARWAALQQSFLASLAAPAANSGQEPAVAGAEEGMATVSTVGKAATRLSTAQSVANVHVMSDAFIRDSITGK